LVQYVKDIAEEILTNDPQLNRNENAIFKIIIKQMNKGFEDFGSIS